MGTQCRFKSNLKPNFLWSLTSVFKGQQNQGLTNVLLGKHANRASASDQPREKKREQTPKKREDEKEEEVIKTRIGTRRELPNRQNRTEPETINQSAQLPPASPSPASQTTQPTRTTATIIFCTSLLLDYGHYYLLPSPADLASSSLQFWFS